MGRILKEVILVGSKNTKKKITALFDTGAEYNYISNEFKDESSLDDIGIMAFGRKEPVIFPNGDTQPTRIVRLKSLEINGTITNNPEFRSFNMKLVDMIIGAKLMQRLGIILKPCNKEIKFKD